MISFKSLRRFSRNALSSALTVTLSKKASTGGRNFAIALMAAAKSPLYDGGGSFFFCGGDGFGQRFSSGSLRRFRVRRAGKAFAVLLLLDAQDVRGALDAGEQVLAVVGVEEFAERFDAADDHQEIVLAFEREHGIDEIVPGALFS